MEREVIEWQFDAGSKTDGDALFCSSIQSIADRIAKELFSEDALGRESATSHSMKSVAR